jgi:uncharacterized protein YggT (Ycf19 family)
MQNILNLVIDGLLVAIEILERLENLIFDIYAILKSDYPIVLELLNDLVELVVTLLRGFNVLFTMRFMLAWFPNINPFIPPYYLIRVATQPYLDFIAKRVPRIFGQDISFFVCSFILNYVLENLPRLKF